ncbi:MAG: alpha/beta fold hydrolase [Caulobacterales bacterium]
MLGSWKRLVLRGLLGLVIVMIVAVVGALGYRAWRQHETAVALAIHTPNGVQEATYVRLGGIDQWVQIRGENRDNPVILFVHGGPGESEAPFSAVFRPWEKDFTVVMWDQRCAGKTFARNGKQSCVGMSIASVAQEGVALTEFLRNRLHKHKVIVVGISWGSMVGLRMAHDRPDLYSAYVGTGQVVSIAEKEAVNYASAMERVRAAHDDAGVRALQAVGPPPYQSASGLFVERNWSRRHDIPAERDLLWKFVPVGLVAPGWSLWDVYEYIQAAKYAEAATFDADASYDARALGTKFAEPVFIFNGALDRVTPASLAKSYFDQLEAPQKAFVALDNAGHDAALTEPDVFLRELVTRVRPIAVQADGPSQ